MPFNSESKKSGCASVALAIGALALPIESRAYELYSQDGNVLNSKVEAVFAVMHSDENYATTGTKDSGSSNWREGFIKYGLNGSSKFQNQSSLYGAFSLLSSGTWGDGDAAGFTKGSERRTAVEDAYLGWRSGSLFSSLGENGIEISAGRQEVIVGDGFLIKGDALSLGDVDLGNNFDRGGAYYLAPRKAFDGTAVLRIGGEKGWRGDLMWLGSDNRAQAETKLAVATLENVADEGTLGLTYIKGLDVNERFATPFQSERDGMQTVSLRGAGSLGIENLNLAVEYATQDRDSGRENAWYMEGSWTFASVPWSPKATYRYSRFSESFDPLFYGNSRGYGTWFQGEVASNYAGPFNSNTRVHHVGLKVTPRENLTIGALYFDFDPIDRSLANLGGREFDIYAEVAVSDHVFISPVLGLYKPDKAASQGGSQLGSQNTNTYVQLIVGTSF
ncbi:alginate export family protein [Pseudomonas moraviensis]|uniref:alginate export family protein n=1 Tax=Pseudomonas moraviensis TaxID=321662 RepID=UPI00215FDE0D|nr:alginate export family protein [Pseudomonas moraviensis]UVL43853.1 alginate export family protein [Pseudomonas moraviensis]